MAYILVPAPGCYGHRTAILRRVETVEEARRYARYNRRLAIYEAGDHETPGQEWLQVYEQGRERISAEPPRPAPWSDDRRAAAQDEMAEHEERRWQSDMLGRI